MIMLYVICMYGILDSEAKYKLFFTKNVSSSILVMKLLNSILAFKLYIFLTQIRFGECNRLLLKVKNSCLHKDGVK